MQNFVSNQMSKWDGCRGGRRMYDFFYVSGSNVLEPESLLHRLKASKSRFYLFFFCDKKKVTGFS